MIKLVNLTLRAVAVYDSDGKNVIATSEPSGVLAVVLQSPQFCEGRIGEFFINGVWVPLMRTRFMATASLPEPEPDTMFIVSSSVLVALRDKRQDIVTPDTSLDSAVRNSEGDIIGVRWFTR